MSKKNTVRDFMVGNIILATLKGVSLRKGMITEIYKDKVKVMDWETKEEEVIDPGMCYGIDITEDLLRNVLKFENHTVSQTYSAIRTETTQEWIKVIYDPEDPSNFYFLIIPLKANANDEWVVEIKNPNRELKSKVSLRSLHQLQNQVFFQTHLVLC
jgi:hypothetical protein